MKDLECRGESVVQGAMSDGLGVLRLARNRLTGELPWGLSGLCDAPPPSAFSSIAQVISSGSGA